MNDPRDYDNSRLGDVSGAKSARGSKESQDNADKIEKGRKNGSLSRSPSRSGTRLIAGHFDHAVSHQLRLIAAEEETTIQALLTEALDLLFVRKGKPRIEELRESSSSSNK